jgi:hypothetical protein
VNYSFCLSHNSRIAICYQSFPWASRSKHQRRHSSLSHRTTKSNKSRPNKQQGQRPAPRGFRSIRAPIPTHSTPLTFPTSLPTSPAQRPLSLSDPPEVLVFPHPCPPSSMETPTATTSDDGASLSLVGSVATRSIQVGDRVIHLEVQEDGIAVVTDISTEDGAACIQQ